MATTRMQSVQEDMPTPEKKPLVVPYNKQANKAKIQSVMPENVQECLEVL